MKIIIPLMTICLGYFNTFGQKVSGKIKVQGRSGEFVQVHNTSSLKETFSDRNGNFTIEANLQDTLILSSLYYETQYQIVDSSALNDTLEIHLKQKHFVLDEVMLTHAEFDIEAYNEKFNNQLREDHKNRAYLYKASHDGNLNISDAAGYIGENIGNMLGLKKKKTSISKITFEDLETLFNKDEFFNDDLLRHTIEISTEDKFLFFSYCESKHLKYSLLENRNKFLLLDKLVTLAKKFRTLNDKS